MQAFNGKYEVLTVPADRCDRRTTTPRPGVRSCVIAFLLVAIPLPAFAEADPSGNIAIALSSSIVESPIGKTGATGVVAGSLIDFSVSVTGPTEGARLLRLLQ